MKAVIATSVMVITVAALSAPSLAVRVTNTSTGALLFESDGFENDTVGNEPTVTSAGTWVSSGPPLDEVVTGGSPGASEGVNYLSTERNGGVGNSRAFFSPQSVPGHVIHMEAMVYLGGGEDAAIIVEQPDKGKFYRILLRASGGNVLNYEPPSYVPLTPTLSYTPNTWQKWEIDYEIGATVFTVTVDGISATGASLDGLAALGGGAADALSFGHNSSTTYYIDGTPPSPVTPPNDDCANAAVIDAPVHGSFTGTTTGATNDGTATCGLSSTSPDVWFSYTPTATGTLHLNTCGPDTDFDTVVSVYTGSCGSLLEADCNDNCAGTPCAGPSSCSTVPVTQGTPYLIRVAGVNGTTGDFSVDFFLTADDCINAIEITPGVYLGSTATATNSGDVSSCGDSTTPDVWYKITSPNFAVLSASLCDSQYDNAVSIHMSCPASVANELACNAACFCCDEGTPSPVLMAQVDGVGVNPGQTVWIRVFGGNSVSPFSGDFVLDVDLKLQPPPANDECGNAQIISEGIHAGSTTFATSDGSSTCDNPSGAPDVWYEYTASCTGDVNIETCDSTYDTIVSLHSASTCPGTSATEIACSDDCGGDPCAGPASCLTASVVQGEKYYIRVSGANGATGDFFLKVACGQPPPTGQVLARNVTTDTVIFATNFELDTPGEPPAVADPGTVSGVEGLDFVTGETSGGVPGPAEGFLYVSTERNEGGSGFVPFFFETPQTTIGHEIHMEVMVNLSAGVDASVFLLHVPTTRTERGVLRTAFPGSTDVAYYNGTAYIDSGVDFIADQWQKWEFNYVIGAGSYTVTIDGECFTAPALESHFSLGGGDITAFAFGHNGLTTYYLDAVPSEGPPANDDCANATAISEGTFEGSTSEATNDGDASCGISSASPDVWYSYTASCTGDLKVNTCGSNFDTVVSIHDNSVCPATAASELVSGCNEDCAGAPCGGPASCVTTSVVQGTTYLIRVSGANGATGDFTMAVSCGSPPANDDCAGGSPTVITDGVTQGTTLGATADGSASCDDLTSPDVWYSYTATCTDTLNVQMTGPFDTVLSIHDNSACPGTGGADELACNDDDPDVLCGLIPSTLSVSVVQDNEYLIRAAGNNGESGDFSLVLTCGPPANDDCAQAEVVGNGTFTGTTIDATPDGDATCGPDAAFSPDVYYAYTVPADCTGPFNVNTFGSGFNTVLSIHDGCPADLGNQIDCNDNFDGFQSSIALESVTPNDQLIIRVSGASGATGNFTLNTKCPVIEICNNGQDDDFDTLVDCDDPDCDTAPVCSDCNDPFADADGDGDADQVDFAALQRCLTGSSGGVLQGCECFDRVGDNDVDKDDVIAFALCASGPDVPADTACDN